MSVTLKLSDQDATIIRDILETTSKYVNLVSESGNTVPILRNIEREFGSASMRTRVNELYGTFAAAVRANQR